MSDLQRRLCASPMQALPLQCVCVCVHLHLALSLSLAVSISMYPALRFGYVRHCRRHLVCHARNRQLASQASTVAVGHRRTVAMGAMGQLVMWPDRTHSACVCVRRSEDLGVRGLLLDGSTQAGADHNSDLETAVRFTVQHAAGSLSSVRRSTKTTRRVFGVCVCVRVWRGLRSGAYAVCCSPVPV